MVVQVEMTKCSKDALSLSEILKAIQQRDDRGLAHLSPSHKSSYFEFAVQSQVDSKAQLVEDPTVVWSETLSSFRRVGVVTVAS